jgi:uncharacterized protein YceH (UPF0502 family)
MEFRFDAMEIRIMGSLIEKELSTPDYYPLSLNALTNACNQKSNRDPVVAYDEADVQFALGRLIEKQVVWKSDVSRVTKYEERFTHEHSLVPRESSVLCVLLLRGPQTVGEIRGRSMRLYEFENLEQVQGALGNLVEWGLVCELPRMPGHKESRYTHLLSGEAGIPDVPASVASATMPEIDVTRIENIEQAIERLHDEIDILKAEFKAFKKQFE